MIKDKIKKNFPDVNLVDSAIAISSDVKDILEENDSMNISKDQGKIEIYLTDESTRFKELAKLFLGDLFERVSVFQTVNIDL